MCPEARKGEVGNREITRRRRCCVVKATASAYSPDSQNAPCSSIREPAMGDGRCAEGRWRRDGRDTVMRLLGGASRGRPKWLVCQDLCGLQASSQFPFTRLHPTVLLQSRSLTTKPIVGNSNCTCRLQRLLWLVFSRLFYVLSHAVGVVSSSVNHPADLLSPFLHIELADICTNIKAVVCNRLLVMSRAFSDT
jgi:hypothetical protein